MRNRSRKTAETLLLEPTKNKEKACKPPGQTQEKGVWDARVKKQNPSRFCARAIAKPKRRFWNPLKRKKYSAQKRKKYSAHIIRNRSQKSAETLFLEPTKNKACPSHCETSATRQSLRKLRRERIRKGRAPAGFVPKPLRNRSRKNAETSLLEPTKNKQKTKKKQRNSALATRTSHCETAAGKMPKRRFWNPLKRKKDPAGFASKPLRNCNLKNLETLLLEPLKTMESCPSHCETSATRQSETSATRQSLRKLRRERIRKGRAPAGFVPKPLRNRSRKNAETSLLEPTKNKQKTKKKQRNSALATRTSHCETAAGKMPKRRFWNPLKRKKDPAGFASKPLRNCNLKNLETLLLEPLKTMESCPSHCDTSATRQSETSATRQSLRKLRRERIRKGRAPAGFVPKPLRNRSRKNAETSLLEPTKNKQKTKKKQRNSALATRTSHCETAAGKMPKRRFWNPLKRKKECPNHAKPQPENCRNVAFGTY